jgi:2-polyprenyl-6-methoxyphenol hydroxylase-like FAD-dependent oxidoreductase
MSHSLGKRAVVIGAGISGLTAAQVLADHFDEVVVLERDDLPSTATPRPGVPQGRHSHMLLAGGLQALSDLFPNFSGNLAKAGAHVVDFGMHVDYNFPGLESFPRRQQFGVSSFSATRPLIELAIRLRVKERRNIKFRSGSRVTGIVATPDGDAVAAVTYTGRHGEPQDLPADVVVDASGRAMPTLDFLQAVNRVVPEDTVIRVDLAYSTAVFTLSPDAMPGTKALLTMASAPERSRSAVMILREDNNWFVTIAGRGMDLPPADSQGFLAFAEGLEVPTVYNAIRGGRLQSEILRFAFPESRRRHFERIGDLPRGLIPIGDSVCRFNPIYGQGMSIAAQQAVVLRNLLERQATQADPLDQLGQRFLAEIQPLIDTPWALAVVPDLAYPDAQGERPENLAESLEYQAALHQAAHSDPGIHKLLTEVLNLLKPASMLTAEDIAEKVMARSA